MLDQPLVLESFQGHTPNAYVISGSVRFSDGSEVPEHSFVYARGLPNESWSDGFGIQAATGEFLIPNTSFTHYGFWNSPHAVESWEFLIEAHNGARAKLEVPHRSGETWIRGVELVVPELPFFEGVVTHAQTGEPIRDLTLFYEDRNPNEDLEGIMAFSLSGPGLETAQRTDELGRFRIYLKEEKVPARLYTYESGSRRDLLSQEQIGGIEPGAFLEISLD